jgi:hypothetical protein
VPKNRAVVAVIVFAVLAGSAASALAAHPKKGSHFSGSFSFTGVNGFKAPVAFTVSRNGKTLVGFSYSTLGCFGSGGFQKGVDYYTKPFSIIKVGSVKVSASGRFSAKGVVFKYTVAGITTTTTTTLSGRFSGAKAASGTVTFSQKLSSGAATCTSVPLSFTAKA